ncbi:hypothetical protein Cgig2_002675 [Carnegiea gigantea]|uniref:Uncharacterized protein n=1 Tax=Carnegiea gigantea TaxID=171969 RepID=A0A9Q1QB48_9CARY|nr:hypothetical protein Cgig2_002675 [Carnegiea gigantea]
MLSYKLAVVEEAAEDYELPELHQPRARRPTLSSLKWCKRHSMLLSEAIELGMVCGFMAEGMKSALGSHGPWPQATSTGLPHPVPRFDLNAERLFAHDSHIPEMVSIIFYTMVIDDAVEFSLSLRLTMNVVMITIKGSEELRPLVQPIPANPVLAGNPSRGRTSSFPSFHDIVQAAEYVRDNLHWSKTETSSLRPNLLAWNFSAYCPKFNRIVAMQFMHATNIPKMVQAIFYAMVINDAARLQLNRREIGESLMSDLQKLRWDAIEAWLLFIEDKLKDARQ